MNDENYFTIDEAYESFKVNNNGWLGNLSQ